jgi:hypothetical protein
VRDLDTLLEPDCSKYVSEYQIVCDVRFVGAAKLEDPRPGAGGDNDLAATEEASSRRSPTAPSAATDATPQAPVLEWNCQ